MEPDLRKMPHGPSSLRRRVHREFGTWHRNGGGNGGNVGLLEHADILDRREGRFRDAQVVDDAVHQCCIREPRSDGLVDVQHVDLVVPAPGVESGAVGVGVDVAGKAAAVIHGGGPGSTADVYREGSIGRVFSRFEVPEEKARVVAGRDVGEEVAW